MTARRTHRVYLAAPGAPAPTRLQARYVGRVRQVHGCTTCPVAGGRAGLPGSASPPRAARCVYYPGRVASLGWADALSYALGIDLVGMLKFLLTL